MSEKTKDPTAADLGISPQDMLTTREEDDRYKKQALRIAEEAATEGEPGTAEVFAQLAKRLRRKNTDQRNAGLNN